MQRFIRGSLILMFALSWMADSDSQEKQATPAEKYKALLKEYEIASSSGRKLTDEERREFIGRVYKLRNKLALKFI